MTLKFTKMHGAGNDFVVLDGVRQSIALSPEQIRLIADRHFGIGCDQILLVEKSQRDDADFRYRIFNADGGEVEQCGNGARCFVRFVHDHKLTSKREIVVETKSGLISPRLEEDGRVTVNMGAPIFDPSQIPFVSDSHEVIQPLQVGSEVVQITAVSMGNPHAVQVVDGYRGCTGHDARAADRTSSALPQARERRLHADRGPDAYQAARVRTRCRRNPVLRHRRLRRRSCRHPAQAAG